MLTYKQTSTVPPSMQALYSNTPIPTIYYYNTTPYPAVPSRGLDLNQKAGLAGKFSLWSLEMSGTQPPDQLYFYKYTSSKSHWFNTIDLTTTGQRIPWTYSLIKYTSVTECHWKTRGKLNAMLWVDIFLKKETIKKIIWHTVFRKMFCYLRKAISDGSCSQLSILTKGPLLSSSTGKINSTYLK